MFNKIEVMQMAEAMATHAGLRQNAVSQNIANADTPGYKAKDVMAFEQAYRSDDAEAMRSTRPEHLGASRQFTVETDMAALSGTASPNGNNVSLEEEMVRAVDIKRQHEQALAIYKSSIDLLRTSLGK